MKKSSLCLLLSVGSLPAFAQTHRIELIGHTTLDLVVDDLDGDGDLDLVTGGLRNLVWYENEGDARFFKHTISLDAQEAQQVLVLDMDNDGHKDLYYRNNGDLTFVAPSCIPPPAE
jgi:glycosyltransferase A (GT-A) superfamily protein (DUF2064 family)